MNIQLKIKRTHILGKKTYSYCSYLSLFIIRIHVVMKRIYNDNKKRTYIEKAYDIERAYEIYLKNTS